MVNLSRENNVASFSLTRNRVCSGIVVLVVCCVLVLDPLDIVATNMVVQDSSGSELDEVSTEKTSPLASSHIDSIEDLFHLYTNNLSRLSAAYDLIGDADDAALIDLLDQVTTRKYAKEDATWKHELISLITGQLAGKNLDKTVSLYESLPIYDSKYMLYGMLHAWASKDFDGAVQFARQQDASVQSIALRGIVDASLNLPEETLMDLGTALGDVAIVKRALKAYKLELALVDPDKAWENMIDDPTIHHEENFDRVQNVANALIDIYGADEIDDLLNSLTSPTLSYGLKKSILSNLALSDPETAFNYALDTPNDVFGTMLATVIDTWANTDPQSALSRIRLLEPSRVRDRLQQVVVSTWIKLDSEKFISSVDSIPIELRDTARLSLIEHLSKDSIEDALRILPEVTNNTELEKAAITIVDAWLDSNPDAAFQWIISNPETERYRSRLLSSFLESFTARDADKAFDLALSQPIRKGEEVGLEAIVIDKLMFSETDHALRLLPRVRAGNTQIAAFESVATALIFDQRTDEAVELGKKLSEREQVSYYNSLAMSITIQESPRKILEILPNVPVKEAQSKIASHALTFQSISQDEEETYSDEEVETLLQYVEPGELKFLRLLIER